MEAEEGKNAEANRGSIRPLRLQKRSTPHIRGNGENGQRSEDSLNIDRVLSNQDFSGLSSVP